MERKGCESIIHDHDFDLWVTMVAWVDVPYSDWGDFRRRRAVDISSFFGIHEKYTMWKFIVYVVHDFVSSLRAFLHISKVFLYKD